MRLRWARRLFQPLVLIFFAFVVDLIIAWMLAGLLGHLGAGQVKPPQRRYFRGFRVVWLRPHYDGGQLHLSRAGSAALAD